MKPYDLRPCWNSGDGNRLIVAVVILLLLSCSHEKFQWKTKTYNRKNSLVELDSLLKIDGISNNSRYGYSADDPIKLGVSQFELSVSYPVKYLSSLTGPHGEAVSFKRIKSCCPFYTVNSDNQFKNLAVLEVYSVNYTGLSHPVVLYINFFDEGVVMAPKGFSYKKIKT